VIYRWRHDEHVPLLTKKSRRVSGNGNGNGGHRHTASQSSMMLPSAAASTSLIIDDNYANDATSTRVHGGDNGNGDMMSTTNGNGHGNRFITSASEPVLLTLQHAQHSSTSTTGHGH
jgi:hypothetical protein